MTDAVLAHDIAAIIGELQALRREVRELRGAVVQRSRDDRYMTASEAARKFRKDRRTIVRMCAEGAIRARRDRGRGGQMVWLIPAHAAEAALGAG